MPQNNKTKQAGNVFVIILVAIALFGMLMFTFSRTSSQGTGNLTKQQARIAAQDILNYAKLIERAVDRVRRNNCSENEISFQNATLAGYTNGSAPGDNSCHVFEPEGGRATISSFSDRTTNGSDWIFSPSIAIVNVGTDSAANACTQNSCTELVMFLGPIEASICTNINRLVTAPDTAAEAMVGYGGLFTGAYTRTDQLGDTPTTYRGVSTACLDGSGSPAGLYFYHVLHAR